LKFAPMAIPAMALLQQHDARRDILIEPRAVARILFQPRQRGKPEVWGRPQRSVG